MELSKDVNGLAAVIRERHGLRTSDMLQAASCLKLGDEHLFLIKDAVFRRVVGLYVRVLTVAPPTNDRAVRLHHE